MRLIVSGRALELSKGTKMSFSKSNPLFGFDRIKCERTQSFNLPDTPINESILGTVEPAWIGGAMRRRIEAEMQDGLVVKSGYLYVDSYSRGTYRAIFVTGELVGLLNIKNAGAIKDYLITDRDTEWGSAISSSEAYASEPLWASVMYEETFPNAIPYPSYALASVMDACFSQLGIPAPSYPNVEKTRALRVVPDEPKNVDFKTTITSRPRANSRSGDYINDLTYPKQYFELTSIEITDGMRGVCSEFEGESGEIPTVVRYLDVPEGTEPITRRKMRALRARFDFDIHFDDNAPSVNMIDGGFSTIAEQFSYMYHFQDPESYWGWRVLSGGTYPMITGSPLHEIIQQTPTLKYRDTWNRVQAGGVAVRGRTMHIRKGQVLSFYDPADIAAERGEAYQWILGTTDTAYVGFGYDGKNYYEHGQKPYDISLSITTPEVEEPGSNVYLLPNLPEFTLVDACKIMAYVSGTVIDYTDERGLTFEALDDIDGWNTIELDGRIVSRSSIKREFGDYAARNVVRFDSSSRVFGFERTSIDYTIDSDNIKQSDDLFVIPFSEGGIGESEFVTLRPSVIRNAVEQNIDKSTLMQAADGDTNLGRVSIAKNKSIQRMCDVSVSVEVSVLCTHEEFERITSKTLLLMDGVRYVWTEIQWSNGIAKMYMNALG